MLLHGFCGLSGEARKLSVSLATCTLESTHFEFQVEWDLHSLEFESICTRVISEQNSCIAHSGNVSLRDPDPGNRGPHQQHRKGGGLQTRSLAVQRQYLHPPTQGL